MSAETQRELGQAIGYRWGQGYRGDLTDLKPLADHATIDDDTRVEAQKLLVDSDVIDDEIAFFHGFAAGIAAYLLDNNITVETQSPGST